MYTSLEIDLTGKKILIVGGGKLGLRRAKRLKFSGAIIEVVSPVFDKGFEGLDLVLTKDSYKDKYLQGVFLAIAATDQEEVNQMVYKDCQKRNILCNLADGSMRSEVIFPAQVGDGLLKLTISTSGTYPLLSKKIKKDLEPISQAYPDAYIQTLGELRSLVLDHYRNNKDEILASALEMDLENLRAYTNKLKEDI